MANTMDQTDIEFDEAHYTFDGFTFDMPPGDGWGPTGRIEVEWEAPQILWEWEAPVIGIEWESKGSA